MKTNRRSAILELIKNEVITNQTEMVDRLNEMGFCANQATVSKDLKALQVIKVPYGDGSRYSRLVEPDVPPVSRRFSDFVTRIVSAGNNVVIKTQSGRASSVALELDQMNLSQVLGCVAGDDTVIAVTDTPHNATLLTEQLLGINKKYQ